MGTTIVILNHFESNDFLLKNIENYNGELRVYDNETDIIYHFLIDNVKISLHFGEKALYIAIPFGWKYVTVDLGLRQKIMKLCSKTPFKLDLSNILIMNDTDIELGTVYMKVVDNNFGYSDICKYITNECSPTVINDLEEDVDFSFSLYSITTENS